jgi:hypothetical protein
MFCLLHKNSRISIGIMVFIAEFYKTISPELFHGFGERLWISGFLTWAVRKKQRYFLHYRTGESPDKKSKSLLFVFVNCTFYKKDAVCNNKLQFIPVMPNQYNGPFIQRS